MIMKKSLMLAGAMMISTFIFAQNDAAAPRRPRGPRENMKTVLALDDKQVGSIDAINKKYHEKGMEQRKGLDEQRQAEISKVLTPEQNEKWTDYKKERADKFVKGRDERLKKDLSLSDDQLAKLKSTLSEEQINRLAFSRRHGRPGNYRGNHGGKHGK
jgi:hypothetical protein